MSAIRLIPETDDSVFPYNRALEKLRKIEGLDLRPADMSSMIEAGRRVGWSAEMIIANEALAERGNCFDFRQLGAPYLQGTLYEDNLFFTILDQEHALMCMPVIEDLAHDLRVGIIPY